MRGDTLLLNSLQLHDNRGGDSVVYRAKSPVCVGSDPMPFQFHGSELPSSARAHYSHYFIDQITMAKNSTQRRKQLERSRGSGGRFVSSTPGGTSTRPDDDPTMTPSVRLYSAVVASDAPTGANLPATSIAASSMALSVAAPSISIPDQGLDDQSPGSTVEVAIQDFTPKSAPVVDTTTALPMPSTPSPTVSAPIPTTTTVAKSVSTIPTTPPCPRGSHMATTVLPAPAGPTVGPGKSAQDAEAVVEDASVSQSSFPRRFFTQEEIEEMRKAERELKAMMLDPTQVDLHEDLQAIIDAHDAESVDTLNDADGLQGTSDTRYAGSVDTLNGGSDGPPVGVVRIAQSIRDQLQKDKEDMKEMLDAMQSYSTEFEDRRRKWEALDGCVMRRIERVQEMLDPEHIQDIVAAPVRREVHYLMSETSGKLMSEFKTSIADILEENIDEFKSNVASFRLDAAEALTSLRDDINAQMIASGQAHIARLQHTHDTPVERGVSQPTADVSTPERVDHRGYPIVTRGGSGTSGGSPSHRVGVRFAPPTFFGTSVSGGVVPHATDRASTFEEEDEEGSVVSHYRGAQEERIGRGGVSPVYDMDAQEDRIRQGGISSSRGMGLQDYHGGRSGLEDGVDLTNFVLQQMGFSHSASFPEMTRLHRTIRRNWFHHTLNTYGPQRETILNSKALIKLTLEKFDPCSVLAWYEKLVMTCEAYKIGLMPFDAIQFARGSLGLCIPGLGTDRFTEMASALCSVLQVCLSKASMRVTTMAAQVESRTRNGYDILWRVLCLYIPGFDPTKTVERPLWSDSDGNIILFANKFDLFYRLSLKNGHSHSDVVKSTLFLTGITEPAMMKVVEPLLIAVESASSASPLDGHLPPRLCFDELAIKIAERMVVEPSDRRILAVSTPTSTIPYALDDGVSYPGISLQGTSPNVSAMDGKRPSGSDRSRRPSQLTRRPDPMNRIRSPTADEVCEACGKRGHVAATCDFLAMSVFLRKFTKQGKLTDSAAKEAERRWLEKWSSRGGKPHTTPQRVYNAYTSMYDISLEQLDSEIDWQCWPVDIDMEE